MEEILSRVLCGKAHAVCLTVNLFRVFKEHWQKNALVHIYHFNVSVFGLFLQKQAENSEEFSLLLRQ